MCLVVMDLPHHLDVQHFKELLLAPQTDAQRIMDQRFPVPRFIVCDQHKSESRFVIAKLNPSVTHNTNDVGSMLNQFPLPFFTHMTLCVSWRANLHRRCELACLHGAPHEALSAVLRARPWTLGTQRLLDRALDLEILPTPHPKYYK